MPVLVLVLSALWGCAAPGHRALPEAAVEIQRDASGYAVAEAGLPILFYQLEPRSIGGRYERSNYIHPLYGLDGEILTEDFPDDHPHHRGIFWTWHQVLVGDVRAGDPWLARRFRWELSEERVLEGGRGVFTRHVWHSPDFAGGREPILKESAEVLVHPVRDDVRILDFDIRLMPLQDGVRLGGSEDDKGYGGFSVRVRMVEGLRFTAAGGPVEPARQTVAAGDWVDFSADFSETGKASGVAVIVHPSSAGYPQQWILRAPATPSMQNPVWPGPEPVDLARGTQTRLRYRLVVHRGHGDEHDLNALAAGFAAEP